jgi:hypothetical protein
LEYKLEKKQKVSELKDYNLCMTGIMEEMYYDQKSVDPQNVSVHSAFICMLHLANEKGINFIPGTDEKFEVDF